MAVNDPLGHRARAVLNDHLMRVAPQLSDDERRDVIHWIGTAVLPLVGAEARDDAAAQRRMADLLHRQLTASDRDVRVLRLALAFYADPGNWDGPVPIRWTPEPTPDGGETARAALRPVLPTPKADGAMPAGPPRSPAPPERPAPDLHITPTRRPPGPP